MRRHGATQYYSQRNCLIFYISLNGLIFVKGCELYASVLCSQYSEWHNAGRGVKITSAVSELCCSLSGNLSSRLRPPDRLRQIPLPTPILSDEQQQEMSNCALDIIINHDTRNWLEQV